ncbi:MAG: hypothetical protein RIQ81_1234 [Pseudomonadota bacterium]
MNKELLDGWQDSGTWISDREIAFRFAPGTMTPSLRRKLATATPPVGFHVCLGAKVIHFVQKAPSSEAAESELITWLKSLMQDKAALDKGLVHTKPFIVRAAYGASVSAEVALDLQRLAEFNRITPEEVVQRHLATRYTVSFCGFQPGFAYLEPLPGSPPLLAPRHDTPRTSVPAGSVALGGDYCAVYPATGPGGWNLIGMAHEWGREIPAWTPGLMVNFERVP